MWASSSLARELFGNYLRLIFPFTSYFRRQKPLVAQIRATAYYAICV